MSSQEPNLRVQINQIDHTLIPPGPLDNAALPRVPVLRIYGASSTGQKTCVHVHQVYPYFFVEYKGSMDPESVNRYIARLSHSLNHAIAVSMKRNPHSPNSQFIRAIILVKGVHFYGFHSSYSPFLKILVADPALISRAVTVVRSGTVMRTIFNVYEGHLSYVLQFLCDFGLYGCGWIDLGEIWERGQEDEEMEEEHDYDGKSKNPPTFKVSPYFRESRMPMEVDVAAHQIMNRRQLVARELHHKLEIPAPPLPPEPLVISVRELWDDERRRRLAKGLSPSPEIPVDPSESSRGPGAAWVAEARWWEEIRKRIERERDLDPKNGAEENLNGWEKFVMTTFDSVQALWEPQYKKRRQRPPQSNETGTNHLDNDEAENDNENPFGSAGDGTGSQVGGASQSLDVEVDEVQLSSQAMDQLMAIEEHEWARMMGENRAFDMEDKEQGLFDEEALPEDGPPPDLQNDSETTTPDVSHHPDSTSEEDPFGEPIGDPSRTHPNLFIEKVVIQKRRRASSADSGEYVTPTKKMGLDQPIDFASPPKYAAGLVVTLPASHTLEEDIEITQDPMPQKENAHQLLPNDSPNTKNSEPLAAIYGMSTAAQAERSGDLVSDRIVDNLDTRSVHWSSSSHKSSTTPLSLLSLKNTPAVAPVAIHFSSSFPATIAPNSNAYVYAVSPPSLFELSNTLDVHNIPNKLYKGPYYSINSDAPDNPREYAGLLYHLQGGDGLGSLEEWGGDKPRDTNDPITSVFMRKVEVSVLGGWEFAGSPPNPKEVKRWLTSDIGLATLKKTIKSRSQIEGPTQKNPYGLKNSLAIPSADITRERQNMTTFALEVFAPSRENRLPDSNVDEIAAAFWSYQGYSNGTVRGGAKSPRQTGIVAVQDKHLHSSRLKDFGVEGVSSELDLLNKIVDIVIELDPDIVVGWEVQTASWGYMSIRGRHFGFDLGDLISRAPSRRSGGGRDQWGMRQTSTFKANGRHVLNLWRIIRSEQTLNMYSFENVAFNVLGKRTPRYSASTLTEWYRSSVPVHAARFLRYLSDRTNMVIDILEEAEVVTKTAEFARVFGVDFFSVISRGSQFKVESFMFRIGKPESLVFLSPSKQDVGKQNAAECMPLVMEPLSAFYNSPLVVLDFQSLYPSIMIAYNYCYSTCLGRITDFKGHNKFGVTDLQLPRGMLEGLHDHINVAPNGIMYVKQKVRVGLLGRMLAELLESRVMVKQAMKGIGDDKALKRILDARQLGLKYIANVTYGYTSASYSGRMPAVEIADSIVQSGRETLEKAVRIIEATTKWGAKVVYGDTDSLFIYLRGKTKDQAFRIGHDMADTITALNPSPVKLKFEKVYLPCVLMAKKRYVGFKYEHPDDREPSFDAKGIETVRRDGIPAQQKMTENCLKILFRTQDLSQVKEYCCRSWLQMLESKASIQDFIFAKEVKMGTYSDKVVPPPGVTVAARRLMEDPNDEPQYGERVPYVIVRGAPNSRLVDRAMAPLDLLESHHLFLDAHYYISRVLIPPLERIFNLVGADVQAWYDEMPKTIRADRVDPITFSPRKTRQDAGVNRFKIDEHFRSSQCMICGDFTHAGVCDSCRLQPQITITELLARIQKGENKLKNVQRICESCTYSSQGEPIKCESIDCAWLFERKKAKRKSEVLGFIREIIDEMESEE